MSPQNLILVSPPSVTPLQPEAPKMCFPGCLSQGQALGQVLLTDCGGILRALGTSSQASGPGR